MMTRRTKVLRSTECDIQEAAWGSLTWYASGALGNSDAVTVGRCVIKPGCRNPSHSHPNCSEVLVVHEGAIRHVVEDGRTVELRAGDVITIPPDLPHCAENIGTADAVLFIVFTTPDRRVRGE